MSIKGDLILVGVLGAGAYLVVTNAGKISSWLGDQIGKGLVLPAQTAIQEGIVQPVYDAGVAAGAWTRETITQPVYDAGVATGTVVREANDVFSTIVPNPIAQTAVKAAASGAIFSTIPVIGPVLSGLFNILAPPSIDKTTPETYAAVQQKFIAAGAVSPMLGNASLPGGEITTPSPPGISPTPTYSYQGNIYNVISSNLGTPAIQLGDKTIPIENLSFYATPEQKASYSPQGQLDTRFSYLTDAQIRNIPNTPFGFSRSEHYSAAAWTEINNTLAAYLGV
jgi:hypothetical protein